MVLGILFGLLLMICTSFAFFNFGLEESAGYHSFISIAVLVSMLTVMILALSVYLYRNYKIKTIRHWPHTQGRIVEINQKETLFGPVLEIEYTYFMNDLQYVNNDFNYFRKEVPLNQVFMIPELRDAEKISDLKDQLVRVYFRPQTPYVSYISCNAEQNPLIVLLPSLIIIPTCLFLLFRIFTA